MSVRKSNPAFLNGVPEMLILELLSRRAMYGYELVQAIRASTREELEFGEGCIYPILHRLESQQMLAAAQQTVGGRQRVVYSLTKRGHAQLAATVSAWRRIVGSIDHALQGGERGKPALA